MKKVILTITLSIIAIAGFLYEPANKTETSNDVAIENAEALAKYGEPSVEACSYYGYCILGGHQYLYDPLTIDGDEIK